MGQDVIEDFRDEAEKRDVSGKARRGIGQVKKRAKSARARAIEAQEQ